MTEDLIAFSALIWLGFVVFIGALVVGAKRYSSIDASYWEWSTQFIPWFTLFIGVHIGTVMLPLNIAHGKTRRDFSNETVIFLVIYSVAISVLILIGWLLERALFSIIDVPQVLADEHLFANAHDYSRIFVSSLFIQLSWTTAGVVISAAYYRWNYEGLLSIAPCVVAIGFVQAVTGGGWELATELIDRFLDFDASSIPAAIVVGLLASAAMMAMAWPIVRDMPMRQRSS
jgi:hypothetical protein